MTERIRPQDLTPTTSSPFMTLHVARVTQPLEELIAFPDLFLSVRSNLRAGDRVDLGRYESGDWNKARVIEFATVLITQSTALAVEFRLLGAIERMEPAKPELVPAKDEPPLAALEIVPGENGGYLVREVTSGHVHMNFSTKKAAENYVRDYGGRAA